MKFIVLALLLAGCSPSPQASLIVQPEAKPVEIQHSALVSLPQAPALSKAGSDLIIEFEVGGRSGYKNKPEAPDARYSGITQGVGYDDHSNSVAAIKADWKAIGEDANRLAATHPYFGKTAQAHLHEVADIAVPWITAYDVFTQVDVAREFDNCKRVFKGFNELRPNAQAALISLTFNRGTSMVGDNRLEMRNIRDLVPKEDYSGIANQLRRMSRVWDGTLIYNGMRRRRYAEAKLIETP
jgi:hypothetical protein